MVLRRVLTSLLALGATTLLVIGCFADLPSPLACPPAARRAIADCTETLAQFETSTGAHGCITESKVHECLLGPTSACTCGDGECPSSHDSCFPSGECPALVTNAKATCPRLEAAPAKGECAACGCTSCVTVCDGYGPTFSAILGPSEGPKALLQLPLDGIRLPTSGALALYVRYRGLSNAVVQMRNSADQPLADPKATQGLSHPSAFATTFQELLLDPVSWSSADQIPKTIVIVAAPGSDEMHPGVTLIQIDCAIPVVTTP